MSFKPLQVQTYYLAGSGAIIGATSIIIKSMLSIDGTALSMTADFGTIGFATIDPGNNTLEEQISFTGLVNNSNGTTTLSGVSSITFESPYTSTSGLLKTHAGAAPFVISNTSGFYDKFAIKENDETIIGQWTFSTFPITPSVPLATTTVAGVVELATQTEILSKSTTGSVGPLVVTPDKVASTLLSDYKVDTGTANTYAIAPSPAITAYTVGQVFSFKAVNANTTASTLNVNSLGTKTIKRLGGASDLILGDILAGQIVVVEYDGTNFQLISPGGTYASYNIQTFAASGTWTKPANAKFVVAMGIGSGGNGGTNGGNGANHGGGGGGGGAIDSKQFLPSVMASTVAVTIGTGGGAVASTFGALLSVAGGVNGGNASGGGEGSSGAGGAAGTGVAGGAGATGQGSTGGGGGGGGGSTSSTNVGGAAGTTDTNLGAGGNGGPIGSATGTSVGLPGSNYGGGGGGAGYGTGTTSIGGVGAPGYMSVVTFI